MNTTSNRSKSRASTATSRHSRLWKVALSLALVTLGIRVALILVAVGRTGGTSVLLTVIAAIVIAVLLVVVPIEIARARSNEQVQAVTNASPGARIVPALRASGQKTLTATVGSTKRIHSFYTWAITEDELVLWQGGRRPHVAGRIAWAAIERVTIANHLRGLSVPSAVRLVFHSDHTAPATLDFFIRRPSRPFFPDDLSTVEDTINELDSHTPDGRWILKK